MEAQPRKPASLGAKALLFVTAAVVAWIAFAVLVNGCQDENTMAPFVKSEF